jgi:hypothetical protein
MNAQAVSDGVHMGGTLTWDGLISSHVLTVILWSCDLAILWSCDLAILWSCDDLCWWVYQIWPYRTKIIKNFHTVYIVRVPFPFKFVHIMLEVSEPLILYIAICREVEPKVQKVQARWKYQIWENSPSLMKCPLDQVQVKGHFARLRDISQVICSFVIESDTTFGSTSRKIAIP